MSYLSKPFYFGSYLVALIIGVVFSTGGFFYMSEYGVREALLFSLLGGAGSFYALVVLYIFIYKMWKAIPPELARTKPGKAVGFLFIPIFNIYWWFVAVWGWSRDWNTYAKQSEPGLPTVSEKLALAIGVFSALAVSIGLIAGFIGATVLSIAIYSPNFILIPVFIYKVCTVLNNAPLEIESGTSPVHPASGQTGNNSFGVASLIFGILCILLPFLGLVFGIVAIILAVKQRRLFRESLSTAGLITGIIGTALWGLLVLLILLQGVFGLCLIGPCVDDERMAEYYTQRVEREVAQEDIHPLGAEYSLERLLEEKRAGLYYEIDGETLSTEPAVKYRQEDELYYEIDGETLFTGTAVRYRINGHKRSKREIRDGKPHGKITFWRSNGQKGQQHEYRDGKPYGKSRRWYSNGQKRWEYERRDGKRQGLSVWWYECGQKQRETEYRDGQRHGKKVRWYENGQKQRETEYRNGQKHGKVVRWHENGHKTNETEYRDGQRHGKSTFWHKNGQKARETEYRDGQRQGKQIRWRENGQKRREIEYRDDQRHGKDTAWYETGQKMRETEYRDGQRHGKEVRWYENGQKRMAAEFLDGKPIEAECWDEMGVSVPCPEWDEEMGRFNWREWRARLP